MFIVVLASCIQFFQDCAGISAAIKLQAVLVTNVRVRRFESANTHQDVTIDQKNLVPGDILYVDRGDTIPADCLLLESNDLLISQSRLVKIKFQQSSIFYSTKWSSLTGESEPQQKSSSCQITEASNNILELENVLLMATNAVSGSAIALVIKTGDGT